MFRKLVNRTFGFLFAAFVLTAAAPFVIIAISLACADNFKAVHATVKVVNEALGEALARLKAGAA